MVVSSGNEEVFDIGERNEEMSWIKQCLMNFFRKYFKGCVEDLKIYPNTAPKIAKMGRSVKSADEKISNSFKKRDEKS